MADTTDLKSVVERRISSSLIRSTKGLIYMSRQQAVEHLFEAIDDYILAKMQDIELDQKYGNYVPRLDLPSSKQRLTEALEKFSYV
jgi:hypothetical protein